jgi:hypothetical protein
MVQEPERRFDPHEATPRDGGAPPRRGAAADEISIERAWLSAGALGGGWEVVREAPGTPDRDPDLAGWGVLSQGARHYTRHRGGEVEVCSVEIWGFASVAQARAALGGFAYPGWRFEREGALLLMSRGIRMAPGRSPRRGVFPDCARIGDRIRANVAELVSRGSGDDRAR